MSSNEIVSAKLQKRLAKCENEIQIRSSELQHYQQQLEQLQSSSPNTNPTTKKSIDAEEAEEKSETGSNEKLNYWKGKLSTIISEHYHNSYKLRKAKKKTRIYEARIETLSSQKDKLQNKIDTQRQASEQAKSVVQKYNCDDTLEIEFLEQFSKNESNCLVNILDIFMSHEELNEIIENNRKTLRSLINIKNKLEQRRSCIADEMNNLLNDISLIEKSTTFITQGKSIQQHSRNKKRLQDKRVQYNSLSNRITMFEEKIEKQLFRTSLLENKLKVDYAQLALYLNVDFDDVVFQLNTIQSECDRYYLKRFNTNEYPLDIVISEKKKHLLSDLIDRSVHKVSSSRERIQKMQEKINIHVSELRSLYFLYEKQHNKCHSILKNMIETQIKRKIDFEEKELSAWMSTKQLTEERLEKQETVLRFLQTRMKYQVKEVLENLMSKLGNSADENNDSENCPNTGDKYKNSCIICMEHVEQNNCISLPCSHTFHRLCIDQWYTVRSVCPLCKTEIAWI